MLFETLQMELRSQGVDAGSEPVVVGWLVWASVGRQHYGAKAVVAEDWAAEV